MRALTSTLHFVLLFAAGCGAEEQPVVLDDGPVAGCVDGDRDAQRHGTACLCCHKSEFGVAGSIDHSGPAVARVVVTDSAGDSVDVVPNQFDNFFRHLKLRPPLFPVVYSPDGRALAMQTPAPHGDCNRCHRPLGEATPLQGPELE